MSDKSAYKDQQNLSFAQLLSEAPSFIAVLVSVILTRTAIVFVDLLDSLGNLLRTAMVTVLSKKLRKDLRYEYNYGIGKVEAIFSLFCDGIVFFGLIATLGLSIYSIINPEQPEGIVIAVVGLKIINVAFDVAFYVKQLKITKKHRSAISDTNCAASLAALLFDSLTLVSLFAMWLLRNNAIGAYISPVISIVIAIYLMIGCIKRTKSAMAELMDRTLSEEFQLKILAILTRFYDRYSQVDAINSHKIGDTMVIDLHLSFEKETSYEDIVNLKKQMQEEFDKEIENVTVNVVVGNE